MSARGSERITFDNLARRISIRKASKLTGYSERSIRGAIERGEMKYIQTPDSSRKAITADFVYEWVEKYCVHQNEPIPS